MTKTLIATLCALIICDAAPIASVTQVCAWIETCAKDMTGCQASYDRACVDGPGGQMCPWLKECLDSGNEINCRYFELEQSDLCGAWYSSHRKLAASSGDNLAADNAVPQFKEETVVSKEVAARKDEIALDDPAVSALLQKVSSSLEELATADRVVWNGKKLTRSDVNTLAGLLAIGALPNLERLDLGRNNIGDPGMTSLTDTFAKGVLAQLTYLNLDSNEIGDEGMIKFSEALGKGALANLTTLDLERNKIGDEGLVSLSEAFGKGALTSGAEIHLDGNYQFTDIGLQAVKDAAKARGIRILVTPSDTWHASPVTDTRPCLCPPRCYRCEESQG